MSCIVLTLKERVCCWKKTRKEKGKYMTASMYSGGESLLQGKKGEHNPEVEPSGRVQNGHDHGPYEKRGEGK